MHFLESYGYFLLCSITIVIAILALVGGISAISGKGRDKTSGSLKIKNINKRLDEQRKKIEQKLLSKAELKSAKKNNTSKKEKKNKKKKTLPRLFILKFKGDLRASAVDNLTESVNAILLSAKKNDRVLACIDSPGGVVHGYGLAASQLQRLVDAKLHLTAAIDKVAASGGYMMACVADEIISAPFAIIGSIGVVAQIPNFNRWLKKQNVDFELLTAGDYKRTLTMFGENTSADRKKMQSEIDETHELFKQHVIQHRPNLDIDKVATGEHWYGQQALELNLVDRIITSDQFMLDQIKNYTLYTIEYKIKHNLSKRIGLGVDALLMRLTTNL
jgi:serine protease SohB